MITNQDADRRIAEGQASRPIGGGRSGITPNNMTAYAESRLTEEREKNDQRNMAGRFYQGRYAEAESTERFQQETRSSLPSDSTESDTT